MPPDARHDTGSGPAVGTQRSGPNRRRKTIRAVSILVYPLYLAGLFLLCERLFWRFAFHVPLTATSAEQRVWNLYFPELGQAVADHDRHAAEPDRFEVLLLGGSVLEQVAPPLRVAFGERLGGGVKVHCLAKSAHTSRDSYLKYQKIRHIPFDLIIIYHGINDVRMNCVGPREYRDDYSHCAWYASFYDRLARGAPSLLEFAAERTLHKIPRGEPDGAMIAFGGEVKTAAAFRRNIESVVADAHRKGTPVVLMSFAYHLPADYTREAFEHGALDYGDGWFKLPAELWGLPANVAKTIDAHNAAVKPLALKYDNVIYIDMNSVLPKCGRVFSDPCHLTEAGCKEFARAVADRLPAARLRRGNAVPAAPRRRDVGRLGTRSGAEGIPARGRGNEGALP